MKDSIQKIIEKIPPFLICGGQEFGFAILHDTNELKMGYFPTDPLPKGWANPFSSNFTDCAFKHTVTTMEDFEEGYYHVLAFAKLIESSKYFW